MAAVQRVDPAILGTGGETLNGPLGFSRGFRRLYKGYIRVI